MKNHSNKNETTPRIPPPPGIEAGYDAIIAYHKKYTMDELDKAGYLEEVPPEEETETAAAAAFYLLCKKGLQVRLTRKDLERLSLLAAQLDVEVEKLVTKWIRQRLHQELKVAAG